MATTIGVTQLRAMRKQIDAAMREATRRSFGIGASEVVVETRKGRAALVIGHYRFGPGGFAFYSPEIPATDITKQVLAILREGAE